MKLYTPEEIEKIRTLRQQGSTYDEIQSVMRMKIPKSSLSYLCRGVVMSASGKARFNTARADTIRKVQKIAVEANRLRFEEKLETYRVQNASIATDMTARNAQLIALAMLYLGEGAKWQGSRSPKLGSSSPGIVRLYIDLLQTCYGIKLSQIKCRVQQRADQNSNDLIQYWSDITGVDTGSFYPSYIDRRTIGKATTKSDYKGVCTVHCAGTHIQLELAEIAAIISRTMRGISSFG